mgnify:CR=1 FL=1
MSSFWSAWIIVLTLPVLIGCAVLLKWNLTNHVGVPEDQNTGHEVDGIEEINNPLPRWWTYMFVLTLVWSVYYLAAYPGLGSWQGFLGWTSSNQGVKSLEESRLAVEKAKAEGLNVQLDREVFQADEVYGPVFQQFAKRDVLDLAYDDDAIKIGQRLFLNNCAQCHGSDARGHCRARRSNPHGTSRLGGQRAHRYVYRPSRRLQAMPRAFPCRPTPRIGGLPEMRNQGFVY